jgi:hypothetical protein
VGAQRGASIGVLLNVSEKLVMGAIKVASSKFKKKIKQTKLWGH